MTNKYTLYYKDTCNETLACLAALENAGLDITFSKVDQKTLFSKDFKQNNPAALTPCLFGENKHVVSAPAIIRFAGQVKAELYGNSALEKAFVDQYLEYILNQIQPEVHCVMKSLYGQHILDMRIQEKKISQIVEELSFLDKTVKGKNYICNDKFSIADISIVSILEQFFRFACNSKQRNSLKSLFGYVANLVKSKELKSYFVELDSLQETEFKQLKVDVVAQEKKLAEEKKRKEDEEAKEKALAEQMEREEKEMLKDPVFPESKVNFDDWKNYVCSEKDVEKKLKYIRETHDENGYSFWKLDYDKLPNTLKELLPSSNCYLSFVNRCDVLRKYIYAVHCLMHKEGDYNIRGVWYMRGVDKLSNLSLNADTEYYFYKKLDPKNEEDWKVISDYFKQKPEDEGKSQIDGETMISYTVIA